MEDDSSEEDHEMHDALATIIYTVDYGKRDHTFIRKMCKLADESRYLVENEMDCEYQKRQLDLLETSLIVSPLRQHQIHCIVCNQDKRPKCYNDTNPSICRSCHRGLRYPRRCKSQ